jgi:hypothetical protein
MLGQATVCRWSTSSAARSFNQQLHQIFTDVQSAANQQRDSALGRSLPPPLSRPPCGSAELALGNRAWLPPPAFAGNLQALTFLPIDALIALFVALKIMAQECVKISDAVPAQNHNAPRRCPKPRIPHSAPPRIRVDQELGTLSNDRSAPTRVVIPQRAYRHSAPWSRKAAPFPPLHRSAITGSRCKPTDPYRRGSLIAFRITEVKSFGRCAWPLLIKGFVLP